jgi:riboflavin synthase alpha subunit
MKRVIARSTVEKLNRRARGYVRRDGSAVPTALDQAARDLGLELVRETSENTRLYRNKQGALVNCWLEGPQSQRIETGGAGFDDQV